MLKEVNSKHFTAEPTFYKGSTILRVKDNPDQMIYIENQQIDELIKLLEEAKGQFR